MNLILLVENVTEEEGLELEKKYKIIGVMPDEEEVKALMTYQVPSVQPLPPETSESKKVAPQVLPEQAKH